MRAARLPAGSIRATSRWGRPQSALVLVWLAGSHPKPCGVTQSSPNGWQKASGAGGGLRTISSIS